MNALARLEIEHDGIQPPPVPPGRLADADHEGHELFVFPVWPAEGRYSGQQRPDHGRASRDRRDETGGTAPQSEQKKAEHGRRAGGAERGSDDKRAQRRDRIRQGVGWSNESLLGLFWDDWLLYTSLGLFSFAVGMWVF